MLYQKKNNTLEPLTGSTLYAETPIGTVIASFLAIAPSGYIKADDTVYTKAQYPELYERIPDVFKDTTNETFTIDLREVALKGIGLSSLTTDHYSSTGLTLGEFIEDRVQQHTHGLRNYNQTSSSTGYTVGTGEKSFVGNAYTYKNGEYPTSSSGRYGATTEVKSVGVNYFVKAKHVALPIDIMDAISEEYVSNDELKSTLQTPTIAQQVSATMSANNLAKIMDLVLPPHSLVTYNFWKNTGTNSNGAYTYMVKDAQTGITGDTHNVYVSGVYKGSDYTWATLSFSHINETDEDQTLYLFFQSPMSGSQNFYYTKNVMLLGE